MRQFCQLARFSDRPCDGRLVRAHLIPRQLLKRELPDDVAARAINDPRSYVLACGGPMGNGGHHGMLDGYQIRIPRRVLPPGTEELARELRLEWFLDHRYGARK